MCSYNVEYENVHGNYLTLNFLALSIPYALPWVIPSNLTQNRKQIRSQFLLFCSGCISESRNKLSDWKMKLLYMCVPQPLEKKIGESWRAASWGFFGWKIKWKCIDITVMCKTHCAVRIILEVSQHFCVALSQSKACPEEHWGVTADTPGKDVWHLQGCRDWKLQVSHLIAIWIAKIWEKAAVWYLL